MKFILFSSKKCIWKCHLQNGLNVIIQQGQFIQVEQILSVVAVILNLYLKLLSGEYQRNSFMRSQHWFMQWLGAIRKQTITWANFEPDLCHIMVSLGHNKLTHWFMINSLWPSDVIWRHGSRSTLAQVMASCLTAPSHYLNQSWLIIREVLWHSPDTNFTENT